MAITTGFFKNQFTFSVIDDPGGYESEVALMELSAVAVINYLSEYVSWNGTLDFALRFSDDPDLAGTGGQGLLPAIGGVASDNHTYAAHEALTGVDENGVEADLGAWLIPNQNGSLTNFGTPLYFDPSPDPYESHSPPTGTHDFFSIYLHEVLHGMGFWSTAQHGQVFGQTVFDTLTAENGGVFYFTGAAVIELLGQNLRLAQSGSRDHYAGVDAMLHTFPFIDRGSVFEFGNYEENRWHLGQLELAVLEDLGWTVANQEGLAVVELPDDAPNLTGNAFSNMLFGDHQANVLNGLGGNDLLWGNQGADTVDGGTGNDWIIATHDDGDDSITGGNGFDILDYSGVNGVVQINQLAGTTTGSAGNDVLNDVIEQIIGTNFDDVLSGGHGINVLDGNGGNDLFFGNNGDDLMRGGDGNDTFFFSTSDGDDRLLGGNGFDILDYSTLPGVVQVNQLAGTTTGTANNDILLDVFEQVIGTDFGDVLSGGHGINSLNGGGGDDQIFANGGDDWTTGGTGTDTITLGPGDDRFQFWDGDGADTVTDFVAGAGTDDQLVLSTVSSATSLAQMLDDGMISQAGPDTIINFGGGDTTTLAGVTMTDLHSDDFIF